MTVSKADRHRMIYWAGQDIHRSIERGVQGLDALDSQGSLDLAANEVEIGPPMWISDRDGHVFLPLFTALPIDDPRLSNWYGAEAIGTFSSLSGAQVKPDEDQFGYHLTKPEWTIPRGGSGARTRQPRRRGPDKGPRQPALAVVAEVLDEAV